MIRTFRYPLKATRRQMFVLEAWRVRCQRLYNCALEQRITLWRQRRKGISLYDQMKELTELRAADPEYAQMPVEVARSALRRLDRAFVAFFRRVKAGEKRPGFPRFRNRHRYDSFGIGRVTVKNGRVRVPKLGWVRFHEYRSLAGEIRDVTIRRSAKRWWVCIAVDLGPAPEKRVVRTMTGIDLGLKVFATLADGESVANPRWLERGRRLLARRQRQLSRKYRGSRNRAKARARLARAHEHVREQRRDFHCKVAADLCARFDLVAHEALNVKGLARSRLAKSVMDAGWGAFLNRLGLKAEEAGVWVVPVDPYGTTQDCSECGTVVRKTLAERTHRCDCGAVLDRDHNAALNILARGRRVSACGGDGSREGLGHLAAPVKQEVHGASRN